MKKCRLRATSTPRGGRFFSPKLQQYHQVSEYCKSGHFFDHCITFQFWPYYGLDPLLKLPALQASGEESDFWPIALPTLFVDQLKCSIIAQIGHVNAKVRALHLWSTVKRRCSRTEGLMPSAAASPVPSYLPCECPRFCIRCVKICLTTMTNPPNRLDGGYYTTTSRMRTFPFRQPFAHTPRHPPMRPHQ